MTKKPAYQRMLDSCIMDFARGKSRKIRPVTESGSGRFAKYSTDHTDQYLDYLKKCFCVVEIGNDAPRGGQLGKYILIKKVVLP